MTCFLISTSFLHSFLLLHSCLHTHNLTSAAGLHQQLTDHTLCFTARAATNFANLLRFKGEGKLL